MLAKANTGKIGRGFGKNAGEWTGRLEISKEEIPGSKRSMYGYILPIPGFKGGTHVTKSRMKIWLTVLDRRQSTANTTHATISIYQYYNMHFTHFQLRTDQNHFEVSSSERQECLLKVSS